MYALRQMICDLHPDCLGMLSITHMLRAEKKVDFNVSSRANPPHISNLPEGASLVRAR